MEEAIGNIWDFHKQGHWIVITTNGSIRKDGACVMGRGIAKQAAQKFPQFPFVVGDAIRRLGLMVIRFPTQRCIIFPVKYEWWQRADLELIGRSSRELLNAQGVLKDTIYMVRPGCGNGGLNWKDVKPVLEKYLDDRFIVVESMALKGDTDDKAKETDA